MKNKLRALIKKEALFKKKVILSSGKESNYYIDLRRVSLSSEGIYLISHLIWNEIKNDNVTAIGGMTLGADPIVSGVCMAARTHRKSLKGFLIRKGPKKHGRQKLIEGKELKTSDRAVIVDDVATSGSSLIKSIEVVKQHKVKVVKVIVVVDRQEGAKENLSARRYPLCSLFTAQDILK